MFKNTLQINFKDDIYKFVLTTLPRNWPGNLGPLKQKKMFKKYCAKKSLKTTFIILFSRHCLAVGFRFHAWNVRRTNLFTQFHETLHSPGRSPVRFRVITCNCSFLFGTVLLHKKDKFAIGILALDMNKLCHALSLLGHIEGRRMT
jgi:hypothetical protein